MRLVDVSTANIYLNSTGVEMIKDMPGIDLPKGYTLKHLKVIVNEDVKRKKVIDNGNKCPNCGEHSLRKRSDSKYYRCFNCDKVYSKEALLKALEENGKD